MRLINNNKYIILILLLIESDDNDSYVSEFEVVHNTTGPGETTEHGTEHNNNIDPNSESNQQPSKCKYYSLVDH